MSLLASLVRAGRCFHCHGTGCDAWLWAVDGTGLHPVHAECLTPPRPWPLSDPDQPQDYPEEADA